MLYQSSISECRTYPSSVTVSHLKSSAMLYGSTGEVKALRREARELKEVVAEQTLELRLLKKSMIADGGDVE